MRFHCHGIRLVGCRFFVVLAFGSAGVAICDGVATTAVAQEMMRDRHGGSGARGGDMRGGEMRGGMGIETGIGIGIGVGRMLRDQPQARPESESSRKRSTKQPAQKTSKKAPKPELTFVGKPDTIEHNPMQKADKLGDLNNHNQVVVTKDGSRFTRHYYFTRQGEQRTWYYYDIPLDPRAPILTRLDEVPACKLNDDDCDEPKVPPTYVDDPPRAKDPPVVAAPPKRTPNTCTVVEKTGEVIGTTEPFDCHGHKGKITVTNDVTIKPIPSAPKLKMTAAEGKNPAPLNNPKEGQFSIRYTGTPCGDCRWIQFFWEDVQYKIEGSEPKTAKADAALPDEHLSSSSQKIWRVDIVSKKQQDTYVKYGADREVFDDPEYCIEKYAMGFREECVPGKDGTEELIDRPLPGTESTFGRIARNYDIMDDSPYKGAVEATYAMHFETYLVCGAADARQVCAKVCWLATFKWDEKTMGQFDKNNLTWPKTFELDKSGACGKDGIQTEGDMSMNDDQKAALKNDFPKYSPPK